MPRTLRTSVALAGAKAGMFTIGLVLSFFGSLVVADMAGTVSPSVPEPHVERAVDPTVKLIARYRCSTTGFADGRIPASALVRRSGTLQHVSFTAGWATYEGRQPGTLVAVCRTPLPR